jgi:hypothetical protein
MVFICEMWDIRYDLLSVVMVKFKNAIFIITIGFLVLFSGCVDNQESKVSETAKPTPAAQITVEITPAAQATDNQVQEGIEFVGCDEITGGPGGTPVTFSPEERGRFTRIVDNITVLGQPTNYTCSPTAGAIDLLHWNSTIAPGLVNTNASALIDDMARRMNTTKNGTNRDMIAHGLVSYFKDHNASSNFTVKLYTRGREGQSFKNGVSFVSTYDIYSELEYEVGAGENIIVDVKFPDIVHSMKLIALNTTADENGEHLAAFADPAKGTVVYGGIRNNGDVDISGKAALGRIVSFIAVSPTNR